MRPTPEERKLRPHPRLKHCSIGSRGAEHAGRSATLPLARRIYQGWERIKRRRRRSNCRSSRMHEPCGRFSPTSGHGAGLACSGARRLWRGPSPQEVVPLRKLFLMAAEGFADPLPSNNGQAADCHRAGRRAGCLSPEDAETWIERMYSAGVGGFQEAWEGNGALGLLVAVGRGANCDRAPRVLPTTGACRTGHGGKTLPLERADILRGGRRLAADLGRDRPDPTAPHWIGLYHPRVS